MARERLEKNLQGNQLNENARNQQGSQGAPKPLPPNFSVYPSGKPAAPQPPQNSAPKK